MTVRIDGTNTVSNPAMTGSDADTGICFGDSVIEFSTSGTKRAAVMDSGNFVIEQGNLDLSDGNLVVASGHGIDFSATANSSGTMSSELLDDYEEGTWIPIVSSGIDDGAGGAATTDRTAGRYTKIGNQVIVDFYLRFDNGTDSTSSIGRIGGLPYVVSDLAYGVNDDGTPVSFTRGGGGFSFCNVATANSCQVQFYGAPANTYFSMYKNGGGFIFGADGTDLSNQYVIGQFIYNA